MACKMKWVGCESARAAPAAFSRGARWHPLKELISQPMTRFQERERQDLGIAQTWRLKNPPKTAASQQCLAS